MYGTTSYTYIYVYTGSTGLANNTTSWWSQTPTQWAFSSSMIAQN